MYHCVTEILLILSFSIHVKSLECISSPNFIPPFCSGHVDNVFNYTTLDNYQRITEVLNSIFNDLPFDVRDFCYPTAQIYTCKYFFPPCNADNQPMAICEESCSHYFDESVCGDTFFDVSTLLSESSLTGNFDSFDNCSSSVYPLYNTAVSRSRNCQRLNKIPTTNKTVECLPIPSSDLLCRGTLGFTYFSVPLVNQLTSYIERVGALADSTELSEECQNFLTFYQCTATYTPCNETSMKIYSFCENSCNITNHLTANCLNFTAADQNLLAYILQFNCSNPLTYTSSLTLDFYEEPPDDMCNVVFNYLVPDDNDDDESTTRSSNETGGLSTGAIVGIVVGSMAIIVLVVIGVGAFVVRKKKKRTDHHIILKTSELTVNPQYNMTLHKSKRDRVDGSEGEAGADVEVNENIVKNYEKQLSPLLIGNSDFTIGEEIGRGAFGKVFKGKFKMGDDSSTEVAIKTIKTSDWSSDDMKSFLLECTKMSDLDHPNVLGIIGICLEDDTPYMLLPFMANGDLKEFLISRRVSEEEVKLYPEGIEEGVLLEMILDIAKGMDYLAGLHFIHRDLAARNCMVDEALNVRIADFGLSRDVYESNYYVLRHSARLPVRWMALESLLDGRFNLTTDVWSYGVTCWEIFSLGQQPYPGISHAEIAEYLSSGQRLAKPHLCPPSLYTLIKSCWEYKSQDRPTFAEIVTKLEQSGQLKTDFSGLDDNRLTEGKD